MEASAFSVKVSLGHSDLALMKEQINFLNYQSINGFWSFDRLVIQYYSLLIILSFDNLIF
jgi:hypothetical protein